MNTRLKYFVSFVTAVAMVAGAYSQRLNITYRAPWGVWQLKYGDHVVVDLGRQLGQPSFAEAYKVISKNKRVTTEWSQPAAYKWNDDAKEFTAELNWGKMVCHYEPVNDTLFMRVTMTNTTVSDTFCGASISLMTIHLPKRPNNFQQFLPYYNNNITAPAVVQADLDDYRLFVESVDVGKKIYVGMLEQNNSNGQLFRIWTGTHPYTGMTDFNPAAEIRLAPKQSFTYRVAIRFCKVNTPSTATSAATIRNFRSAHPYKLKWKDRRPIGELFLSSFTENKNPANPRSWIILPAGAPDITTIAGKEQFKKSVLEYADRSIAILKEMNAQGMITWDLEGQQYPHPLSYIGSPEILEKVAPEMNAVADEYFKKFRNAGFKTGICLRPDSVIFKLGWIDHVAVKDPAANLIKKISYARKRWGCTIFYVDSNVDPLSGQPMDYTVFKKICEQFPDVLIVPEHKRPLYYGYSAPYEDLRMGGLSQLTEDVKSIFPEGFLVTNVPEGLKGTEAQNVNTLINSMKQGNILLFRAWYNDQPTNGLIKKAMNTSQIFK